MKKSFLFFSFILLLNTKSHSQTQFPFTGFELSNYEIGDTLEYSDSNYVSNWVYTGWHFYKELIVIIDKQNVGIDTIIYTYESSISPTDKDTFTRVITNNLICNSVTGIPWRLLYCSDTFVNFTYADSVVVSFDTINGLKRLTTYGYDTDNSFYPGHYQVIQNIGMVNYDDLYFLAAGPAFSFSTLIYAHLAHYGIYGSIYVPLFYYNIDETKKDNLISIYPNPADENLFIQKTQRSNSTSVELYNYAGQLVFQNKNFNEENIDTKNLQNGFYVLKYADGNNYSVKKFLVQH